MIETTPHHRLDGRTAIVTGGSSGIGLAIVRALAASGASVLFTGRDAAKGVVVSSALQSEGLTIHFIAAEMASRDAPAQIVAAAMKHFGGVDILVNNAGMIARGTVTECDDDAWDRLIDVNLGAPLRMMRAAIPVMCARGSGSIVNVASDWGLVAARRAVAYATSKAALVQLTRCAALDHAADGIRINAVCPGDTDTPMLDASTGAGNRAAMLADCGADIPMGRVAQAGEIAQAVLFLASAQSSFVTGIALPVDGGATAG